jgi:antibiotic biosynthesis monooxygenase (ABM) superfamily enzyme
MTEGARSVSIVTQTCVRPESAEAFARWQGETSTVIANFPGFIEQRLMPPKPPLQVDWVILQRFGSLADAQRWLASSERQTRIDGIAHMLVGRDDVHIVQDEPGAAKASPVSAVIATRVKPGRESEYRAWERRIAAAQSRAPGLQGYRFEPAVPGVQDDQVAILRFDNEQNLNAWLESPERRRLLAEAEPLTEEFRTRTVRAGFEQWFREGAGAEPLPVWKMDMLVLLMLYPIVFLFGIFVATPLFSERLKLPFAIALFLGNIVSVTLTGYLVPKVANYFGWWLHPNDQHKGPQRLKIHLAGAASIVALYAVMVVAFWRLF